MGRKKAAPILLDGLRQLEYRGYDSAGIALEEKGKIVVQKAVGKVAVLEGKIGKKDFSARMGIAHTRWATHGAPSNKNSHPHGDCRGEIFLVHNGIIENYRELKKMLQKKKHHFVSETDSEVLAHLIEEFGKKMTFKEAVLASLKLVQGTYGLAIISRKEPGKLIAVRQGSPLILGVGKEEFLVASDVSAIVRHTDKVVYLEDGEIVELDKNNFEITTIKNKAVEKDVARLGRHHSLFLDDRQQSTGPFSD